MKIQDRIYKYFDINSRLRVLFIFESVSKSSDALMSTHGRDRSMHNVYIYSIHYLS